MLLSAVPLYLLKPGRQGGIEKDFLKCWFSDGGICSNFPIHFFDAPLPRWPTFGINLRPLPKTRPCSPDECDDVFWPETDDERERGDRAKESFFTYWDGNESRGLLAFLGAVHYAELARQHAAVHAGLPRPRHPRRSAAW